MNVWRAMLLIGWVAVALCACGRQETPTGRQITVAVSIDPQAWLVERIGGNRVRVITLVGPGESPHTYQPSDAQMTAVMSAMFFFRMGATFEASPWFRSIEEGNRGNRVRVFDLREGIELLTMEHHHHEGEDHDEHEHDSYEGKDPHIWLSPRLLKVQAETIARALGEVDPEHADEYRQRLTAVQAELDELDAELRKTLEPYAGKTFFVFHPAWGYFADDYGLRQIAIEVEGKAPTDSELTHLQELARQENAKVIFTQPQFGGKVAQSVASAIGAEVKQIDPQARDLPENLRQVAAELARSFSESAAASEGP